MFLSRSPHRPTWINTWSLSSWAPPASPPPVLALDLWCVWTEDRNGICAACVGKQCVRVRNWSNSWWSAGSQTCGMQEWDSRARWRMFDYLWPLYLQLNTSWLGSWSATAPVPLVEMQDFPVPGHLSAISSLLVPETKTKSVFMALEPTSLSVCPHPVIFCAYCRAPSCVRAQVHVSSIIQVVCWPYVYLCVSIFIFFHPAWDSVRVDACGTVREHIQLLLFVCVPGQSCITGCVWTWYTAAFLCVSRYKREYRPSDEHVNSLCPSED